MWQSHKSNGSRSCDCFAPPRKQPSQRLISDQIDWKRVLTEIKNTRMVTLLINKLWTVRGVLKKVFSSKLLSYYQIENLNKKRNRLPSRTVFWESGWRKIWVKWFQSWSLFSCMQITSVGHQWYQFIKFIRFDPELQTALISNKSFKTIVTIVKSL